MLLQGMGAKVVDVRNVRHLKSIARMARSYKGGCGQALAILQNT